MVSGLDVVDVNYVAQFTQPQSIYARAGRMMSMINQHS